MKHIYMLIAFNIVAIPILFYIHSLGECKILDPFLVNVFPQYCQYVNNLLMNIGYINLAMIFFALMSASKGGGGGGGKPSGGSKPASKPSGGGHGGGH